MQAVVDGVTHNTNGMTGQQLLGLTQAAQATVLTVLQTHHTHAERPDEPAAVGVIRRTQAVCRGARRMFIFRGLSIYLSMYLSFYLI